MNSMSKADEWLAIYNQQRALFEKAATAVETLSDAEQTELKLAVAELEQLAQHLGFRVEFIDPSIAVAAKAVAIFDAHYRRKFELDRKFFDDVP
jgi:hypothetical protein